MEYSSVCSPRHPFSRLREKVPEADEGALETALLACPHPNPLPQSGRGGTATRERGTAKRERGTAKRERGTAKLERGTAKLER